MSPKSVEELIADLESESAAVREAAAEAVAKLGPASAAAVPALLNALRQDDPQERCQMIFACYDIGPIGKALVTIGLGAVPALVDTLGDDSIAQVVARHALAQICPAAVPSLIEALRNENDLIRHGAVLALSIAVRERPGAAPAIATAVPALIEVLQDPDIDIRHAAASALSEIGPRDAAVIPTLLGALSGEDAYIRARAAVAIGKMGKAAAVAIPALIAATRDANLEVRKDAADALGKLGPSAATAVPALIDCLRGDNLTVREHAVRALREIGPLAVAAVPNLMRLFGGQENPKDFDVWSLRESTEDALERIGAGAVPTLIKALSDEDGQVRAKATFLLGKMSPLSTAAMPALIEALADEQPFVRETAASLLGQMGKSAVAASPELIAALADKAPQVRVAATAALRSIGAPTAAVPALSKLLLDESPDVRQNAVAALGEIGPDVVPALVQALRDENAHVRQEAVAALMKSQPDAAWVKEIAEAQAAGKLAGLEIMGEKARAIKEALEDFRRIGEACRERNTDRFAFRVMAKLLGDSESTLRNRLADVSNLFHEYFRDVEGKTLATDENEEADFDQKVVDRGEKRKPTICGPWGWRAWTLTCEWLKEEEQREEARKRARRRKS